jgi:hypothetical protein
MSTDRDLPELPEALQRLVKQHAWDANPYPDVVADEYERRSETDGEAAADAWLLRQQQTDPTLQAIAGRALVATIDGRRALQYALSGRLVYDPERDVFIPVQEAQP